MVCAHAANDLGLLPCGPLGVMHVFSKKRKKWKSIGDYNRRSGTIYDTWLAWGGEILMRRYSLSLFIRYTQSSSLMGLLESAVSFFVSFYPCF